MFISLGCFSSEHLPIDIIRISNSLRIVEVLVNYSTVLEKYWVEYYNLKISVITSKETTMEFTWWKN